MKNQDLLSSIPELEARILEHPDDANSYYYLGYLYECAAGNDAKAKQHYLNHLIRSIGYTDADTAVADLRESIGRDDHDPILHIRLGEIYGYQNLVEEAEVELKQGTVWTTVESDHYSLSMISGSAAYNDRNEIIEQREKAVSLIQDVFQLDLASTGQIKYYLYESRMHKGMITGDQLPAHALIEKGEVHAVYSRMLKNDTPHEDAHIVLGRLGRPPKFFEEGAAEFFWQQETVHSMYLEAVNGTVVGGVSELIDDRTFEASDLFITYPMSASFVAFLVEKHGVDAFKQLYRLSGEETEHAILKIYGAELKRLEEEWKSFLINQAK
jgi:hypothetical protein